MNVLISLLFSLLLVVIPTSCNRSFVIDYPNYQFLKDGQPYRFISGSVHYFRSPPELWKDRLTKMRAAGFNAVATVVVWALHEPEQEQYDFFGQNDLVQYIKTAQEVGLDVILRPGPFVDAEMDMGGFPYWMIRDYPGIRYRTSDKKFLDLVTRYFTVLLAKVRPLLYQNGGPIIMVQSENEYGYFGCDFTYTTFLRNLFRKLLSRETVLFTNDGVADHWLRCGKVDNVLATLDMPPLNSPKRDFAILRNHQELGPVCLSEFYAGRLDIWERRHSIGQTRPYVNALDGVLKLNASVNIYMFHGGTTFGFNAGSIDYVAPMSLSDQEIFPEAEAGGELFYPTTTSYDHDSPLDEAGDPTPKYFAVREVVKKYVTLPNIPVPKVTPKMEFNLTMKPITSLFDEKVFLKNLSRSKYPQTFEQLNHPHGFMLYSTVINTNPSDPGQLNIQALRDRAHVYVDRQFQGVLSRTRNVLSMALSAHRGSRLDIFVENQGRHCMGPKIVQMKGIRSNVTLGPEILTDWNHSLIFTNWTQAINELKEATPMKQYRSYVPTFFKSDFQLPNNAEYPLDTFLRLDGWRKGVAFLNNFNLGRYWPVAGPQITLYVPKTLFKKHPETNTLVLFELEDSPCHAGQSCSISFVKQHVVNGPVPYGGKFP